MPAPYELSPRAMKRGERSQVALPGKGLSGNGVAEVNGHVGVSEVFPKSSAFFAQATGGPEFFCPRLPAVDPWRRRQV